MAYQVKQKSSGGSGSKSSSKSNIDARLKEMLRVPIPAKAQYWNITPSVGASKGVLSIFKKNQVTEDVLYNLRKLAEKQPGDTLSKLIKLRKTNESNPDLCILSAFCQQKMLLNSSDGKKVLTGLMTAAHEAAQGLMTNGISVYNCETFFHIYFSMLERLKRQQMDFFKEIEKDPRLDQQQKVLRQTIKQTESLYNDKRKVLNIFAHLKNKLKHKGSHYIFTLDQIKKVTDHITSGRDSKMVDICQAKEWFAYFYAITLAMARCPVLNPLVDRVLARMESNNHSILLRKTSVMTVRSFINFRLSAMEGARERMVKIGESIYTDNMSCVKKLETAPIYQVYESDPFFNIAYVTQLTSSLFPYEKQLEMLKSAKHCMVTMIKMDMTKKQLFADSARKHVDKLDIMLETLEEDHEASPKRGKKAPGNEAGHPDDEEEDLMGL